jgi:hypothetical protein
MLLKIYNKSLIQDKEKTYLTAAAAATATSLTVVSTDIAPAGTSSNTWADNDYMFVGELGTENCEVMQMAAAVTTATGLTIDREGSAGGLRYTHSVGEPVYKIDFNQACFYNNTTDTTTGATLLTTINLQPDDDFTRYEDTSNTTGYGFGRFKNATTNIYSSYSDGVNYEVGEESSSRDPRTLWMLRGKVRMLIDEPDDIKISDVQIDNAVNDKQRDIAHQRLWSFYEYERSLSLVSDKFAYDIPDKVHKVHSIRVDTQPIIYWNKKKWDELHWNTNSEATIPSHFTVWNNQILFTPRPSTSAATTTLGLALTATDTTVTVVASTSFNRGDYYRFIVDSEVIYATDSTSTTFTGCLRGQEGTTATTHLLAATVTERDIVINVHVEPTDLLDTQDRTTIPEPEVLTYGTAMDLALLIGKETLHDRLKIKYDMAIKQLEGKFSTKQSAQFGRIKDKDEFLTDSTTGYFNPNNFPRDLS